MKNRTKRKKTLPQMRISPAAAVLFFAMLITDRTGLCAAVLLSAAVHECGHLAAAWALRIPLRSLRLDLLGARLEVVGRMLSYGEEWLLCMAGPLISLLFAATMMALPSRGAFLPSVAAASCLLGVLNLLPIRGFDGGRMLSSALGGLLSAEAAQAVLRVSSFFCLLLIWSLAVYCLLRVGDGLSLFCFSMSLFLRFLLPEERG